jgi:hypothetical protein
MRNENPEHNKLTISCRHLLFAGGDQTKAVTFLDGQGMPIYLCEQCEKSDVLPWKRRISDSRVICEDCIRPYCR